MKKKISISVTDFALPAPRRGSIDTHSGFGHGQFTGNELHKLIQQDRAEDSSYQSEVWISHEFPFDDYVFIISGKMDGVFSKKKVKIEEIKSSFNIFELLRYLKADSDQHPYCLQLKTYGYLHWLKTKEIPDLSLHLVSSRNGETMDFKLYLDIKSYEEC